MKIDDKYKIRSIAGENLIIMQGRAAADMTKVVSLNDTSVWLFGQLAGRGFEAADVAAMLVERYGIEQELADRDAAAWIDKLASCGIIVP